MLRNRRTILIAWIHRNGRHASFRIAPLAYHFIFSDRWTIPNILTTSLSLSLPTSKHSHSEHPVCFLISVDCKKGEKKCNFLHTILLDKHPNLHLSTWSFLFFGDDEHKWNSMIFYFFFVLINNNKTKILRNINLWNVFRQFFNIYH